jgi:hypothetical protein
MLIDIDVSVVPPVLTLTEPDDFSRFSVRVAISDHTYVAPSTVKELAMDHAKDTAWLAGFESMLQYASTAGWVGKDGAVRAHIEQNRPGG